MQPRSISPAKLNLALSSLKVSSSAVNLLHLSLKAFVDTSGRTSNGFQSVSVRFFPAGGIFRFAGKAKMTMVMRVAAGGSGR